ncbi:MAG: hypothetical protein AA908_05790 [Chlorobi bacterium NICIL-2]|nr:MAG: hypothetical protein AA908_05790 [Chlorobi bacterium NICIL-2]
MTVVGIAESLGKWAKQEYQTWQKYGTSPAWGGTAFSFATAASQLTLPIALALEAAICCI